MMERALKERIIGAIVLVIFVVLVVPIFLDGPPSEWKSYKRMGWVMYAPLVRDAVGVGTHLVASLLGMEKCPGWVVP